jgi:hypothetical protein
VSDESDALVDEILAIRGNPAANLFLFIANMGATGPD